MSIEEKGVHLLTDPGMFTREAQERLIGIDAILYTHEHQDHFHLESLRLILRNNPKAVVIANRATAMILQQANIPHQVLDHEGELTVGAVSIKGFGTQHAVIHASLPLIQNTGLYIADRLWYPGDAFPQLPVHPEIIALPIAGPWMKMSDAIDYAISIKPSMCFNVHDALLSEAGLAVHHRMLGSILEPRGITYMTMENGQEYSF